MNAAAVALPPLPLPPLKPRRLRVLPPLHQRLLDAGAECWRCPLARGGAPHRPVATEWMGKGPPAVALVGEAPGVRETRSGRPFVGPSGKLLAYACGQLGIARHELAILNAAACGPIPSENDAIKNAATSACRPRLINDLRRLRPKVITAIGSYALKVLAEPGIGGVTTVRGALLPIAGDINEADAWAPQFTATFHPAHILRGGDGDQEEGPDGASGPSVDLLYYFFLYDLAKAYRLAHGQVQPWTDEGDLFVFTGEGRLRRAGTLEDGSVGLGAYAAEDEFVEAIERVHAEAREHGWFACDVETDSKDSLKASLTAVAVATVAGGVSATWRAFVEMPRALAALRRLLADASLEVDFHNKIYDTLVLPRHGLPIKARAGDTLLMHHAAFPGLPHKLDQVATQFFITEPWKAEFRRGERDEASLVLYNYRDAHATARLRPPLMKMIEAHHVERVYEADRQQFSVATHMRRVGYFVDRVEQARQSAVQHARLDYMRTQLEKDFAAIEEKWRQALARLLAQTERKKDPVSYVERVALRYVEIAERDKKPTDVGLLKTKAKKDIVALFEVLRIPITNYTKKGAPVTDKKAMEGAAARHPLMRRLIHIREAQHLIATYIDGLPVRDDGRAHPDWSPKITGRWGAGKAQNIPNFVSGWPPAKNDDGTFKTKPSGDFDCPKENPRAIIAAPTREEVIALYETAMKKYGSLAAAEAAGGYFPFAIYARAKLGHGRKHVGADFEQIELRVAGFLARDPFLLDIFKKGLDPHSIFARVCFPEHFPKLEAEIADAGFGPKEDLSEEIATLTAQIAQLPDGLDDITRMRLRKLRERVELLIKIGKVQKQWKRLRDLSKRGEYGGIYGGKAITLYDSMVKDFPELTLDGLEKLLVVINDKMAGVVRWRNGQEAKARRTREVREMLLGRVRLFPLGNFNPNIVYNFPIQAFAASLLALSIFRFVALTRPELLDFELLYRHGLLDAAWIAARKAEGFDRWHAPVDPLINGHDSLLAECDDEDAERCAKFLELCMTHELPLEDGSSLPCPGEAGVGQRWSET